MKACLSWSSVRVLWILVALVTSQDFPRAHAQAYPSRSITLVVPFTAGGGIDILARLFADKLQEKLQQPFIVENRTGAGGIIGTDSVARASPDGYTLLFMEGGAVLAKWLHKRVPFDVTSDFTPVAMVATTYLGLFAHPSLPVSDAKDLIAYGKANPGKLSAGTPGVGTPHHLTFLMFNKGAGIDITHVPYRGTPPSVNDLVSGQIPLVWAVPINVLPFVEQGKAKALGVSALQRIPMLPQTPTIAENAVPRFEVVLWLGIAAPAKTPPEIITRLGQAIREVIENSDVQKRAAALGYGLNFRPGEKFHELIVSDHEKYGKVIREAGIQPE